MCRENALYAYICPSTDRFHSHLLLLSALKLFYNFCLFETCLICSLGWSLIQDCSASGFLSTRIISEFLEIEFVLCIFNSDLLLLLFYELIKCRDPKLNRLIIKEMHGT